MANIKLLNNEHTKDEIEYNKDQNTVNFSRHWILKINLVA